MPREKSRHRDRDRRSCSSYSSESSYERKKSKSKYKKRSRSRSHERSESSSHRKRRSSSRTRRRKSYSRSPSRERYEKSRRRSSSRSRSKRDQTRSRSKSKSKSKHNRNKKSKRRSPSSSSSNTSFDIERPLPQKNNLDDTESKIEKAIKAAEAAGLTMTKIPTYEYKEVEIKEDMPTIQDRNLLAEINSDSFVQKPFTSSKSKKESKNIVIDLDSQTVKLPESGIKQKEECVFNFDEIPNEEELKEMWIKKVHQFRKKMLRGEI